jgi:hypothetical protein
VYRDMDFVYDDEAGHFTTRKRSSEPQLKSRRPLQASCPGCPVEWLKDGKCDPGCEFLVSYEW